MSGALDRSDDGLIGECRVKPREMHECLRILTDRFGTRYAAPIVHALTIDSVECWKSALAALDADRALATQYYTGQPLPSARCLKECQEFMWRAALCPGNTALNCLRYMQRENDCIPQPSYEYLRAARHYICKDNTAEFYALARYALLEEACIHGKTSDCKYLEDIGEFLEHDSATDIIGRWASNGKQVVVGDIDFVNAIVGCALATMNVQRIQAVLKMCAPHIIQPRLFRPSTQRYFIWITATMTPLYLAVAHAFHLSGTRYETLCTCGGRPPHDQPSWPLQCCECVLKAADQASIAAALCTHSYLAALPYELACLAMSYYVEYRVFHIQFVQCGDYTNWRRSVAYSVGPLARVIQLKHSEF